MLIPRSIRSALLVLPLLVGCGSDSGGKAGAGGAGAGGAGAGGAGAGAGGAGVGGAGVGGAGAGGAGGRAGAGGGGTSGVVGMPCSGAPTCAGALYCAVEVTGNGTTFGIYAPSGTCRASCMPGSTCPGGDSCCQVGNTPLYLCVPIDCDAKQVAVCHGQGQACTHDSNCCMGTCGDIPAICG